MPTPPIHLKRIYEDPSDTDGTRVLVDRLWPRGIKKDAAQLDAWCKSAAPSNDLRKWFHADPGEDRWDDFRQRYLAELEADPEATAEIRTLSAAATLRKPLTLLYAARDESRNHAIVLRDWLQAHRQ
ncbi:MAG: DUF488 family protein [Planctomycetota bacterium]|nr:MAG: DUF488 family protein [Planctomycetota bacterium]